MSEWDRHLDYEERKRERSSRGGSGDATGGCLGCLVLILLIWALAFGVTWGGVHHEITCSQERGVEIK